MRKIFVQGGNHRQHTAHQGLPLEWATAAKQRLIRVRPYILLLLLIILCAQSGTTFAQTPEKPFGLPFNTPPGPNTWQLIQGYGNTTGAYANRITMYAAGQGIHFGVDLGTPCGTPIVAIGDGVVVGADGPWGSAPHNLLINHENGWMSMYGHLLKTPTLKPGQRVKKGDVVAFSGDPDGTCFSRPHLHLEIRDAKNTKFVNPINLIDADWDTIALTSQFGRGFERNLDNPRQWQTLYDQPDGIRGGPFLNDYKKPWPPAFTFR